MLSNPQTEFTFANPSTNQTVPNNNNNEENNAPFQF